MMAATDSRKMQERKG